MKRKNYNVPDSGESKRPMFDKVRARGHSRGRGRLPQVEASRMRNKRQEAKANVASHQKTKAGEYVGLHTHEKLDYTKQYDKDQLTRFLADSGATEHMTNSKLIFKTLDKSRRIDIKCANDNDSAIMKSGE